MGTPTNYSTYSFFFLKAAVPQTHSCGRLHSSDSLTCEDVVIMVHLVELNALVEHVQLFCSQHLAFPVGVA